MIRQAAEQLPDPAHTKITLMHYLAPVYWEYGGDSPETARYLGERAREEEAEEEELTLRYFDKARVIFATEGVSPKQIQTKENWSANNVTEAVLSELRAGEYSGVVIGREHHNALARLLHLDLAHALNRHTDNIAVWIIDVPKEGA
jgi:hypothetical protein